MTASVTPDEAIVAVTDVAIGVVVVVVDADCTVVVSGEFVEHSPVGVAVLVVMVLPDRAPTFAGRRPIAVAFAAAAAMGAVLVGTALPTPAVISAAVLCITLGALIAVEVDATPGGNAGQSSFFADF